MVPLYSLELVCCLLTSKSGFFFARFMVKRPPLASVPRQGGAEDSELSPNQLALVSFAESMIIMPFYKY